MSNDSNQKTKETVKKELLEAINVFKYFIKKNIPEEEHTIMLRHHLKQVYDLCVRSIDEAKFFPKPHILAQTHEEYLASINMTEDEYKKFSDEREARCAFLSRQNEKIEDFTSESKVTKNDN